VAKLHYVKKALKSKKRYGIKKGKPYYWWKFGIRFAKCYSLTKPPRSAYTTTSPYLRAMMDLEDRFHAISTAGTGESVAGEIDEIVNELESLQEETQEKLDAVGSTNLGNGSPVAELLQERVDACGNLLDSLRDAANAVEEIDDEEEITSALSQVDWTYE
jgi:hypothetical protein